MTNIDFINPPARQFKGPAKRRHREIVAKGGAYFIATITGDWNRSIAPSKLLTYTDCPAQYLRQEEGDLPVSVETVAKTIGNVVHEQIATPVPERKSVAAAVTTAAQVSAKTAAAPIIPKREIVRAVKTATAMVAVVNRSEEIAARRRKTKVLHEKKEPKPFFHYDPETRTFWYAKPDKIQVVETESGRFVGVDDTKTGVHRHRYANLVPFMFGLVVQRSHAWEKFWGIEFEGNIKTRLVYLRGPDGKQLSRPEYVVDTIKPQLTVVQQGRLVGIQGFIRDVDASWARGHFRVQAGSHCSQCPYKGDCTVGRDWLALQSGKTA